MTPVKGTSPMTSALEDRITRWETDRKDQARKTAENTKTLTVKVAPEVAEHLTRLAKETKTSRTVLVREIFDDGYAKLCKAEKRIKRTQEADTPPAALPADEGQQLGVSTSIPRLTPED